MRVGDEQEIELGDLLEDSNQPEDLIIQSVYRLREPGISNISANEVLFALWSG